jgi:hypothetical protein
MLSGSFKDLCKKHQICGSIHKLGVKERDQVQIYNQFRTPRLMR